jgi:hypothetical protein
LTLSIIGFSALAAHTGGAIAFSLNDAVCHATSFCIRVPFEPDPYHTLLRAGARHVEIDPPDLAVALASTLALSAAMFGFARPLAETETGRRIRFGWMADLVESLEGKGRYTTAFVLSTVTAEGAFLGYEGLVENVAVNSEKEITSLTLLEVSRFIVKLKDGKLERFDVERQSIERLFIEKSQFYNVALTVFEDTTEAEIAP